MARRINSKRGGGKLTAKQDEVRKLLESGQSIVEVAELMETTAGAVKAQVSRIRKAGVTVSITAPRREAATASPKDPSRTVSTVSVEDHLKAELERVSDRLVEVGELSGALAQESDELTERKARLEQARSALTSPTKPALAAVA